MLKGLQSRSRAVVTAVAVILIYLAVTRSYKYRQSLTWQVPAQTLDTDSSISLEVGHASDVVLPPKDHGSQSGFREDDILPCQELPGGSEVVVVMRTGATEIQDKLPAHINTTFRCYPDLLIFSDLEEIFMDHQIHDVLGSVDDELKTVNPDFELYTRLKAGGRAALRPEELSGKASFEGSKSGKNSNAGWRLDKWKFLPMMVETLRLRPNKKWYVFIESDSYMIWSNMLQWLDKLDPTRDIYAGSEVQIGPDLFAHGGSVFVMSRSAVEKGARIYRDYPEEWHSWTGQHWAGDCVLGKALNDAGVPLSWVWPMFQGGQPEKMDFTEWKGRQRLWCVPALSYHHFSPTELKRMWNFEQHWIQSQIRPASARSTRAKRDRVSWEEPRPILHHRKVFKDFVLPNITDQRNEWNNLSPDFVTGSEGHTFEDCRSSCDANGDCLQYSLTSDGCFISTNEVMLGQPWGAVQSGWMLDRVQTWMKKLDDGCKGHEAWIMP